MDEHHTLRGLADILFWFADGSRDFGDIDAEGFDEEGATNEERVRG